jgi:hypothetical protein
MMGQSNMLGEGKKMVGTGRPPACPGAGP